MSTQSTMWKTHGKFLKRISKNLSLCFKSVHV